jgi:hypothetical protein
MKTAKVEKASQTGFAPSVVSRLFAGAYLQHEKLRSIEEQIAKLNQIAEFERQKAKEIETAINQLVECAMSH